MIDNLKRSREPLTWMLILLVAAQLVLGVVRLVLAVGVDGRTLPEAAQEYGASLLSLAAAIGLVALVCTGFFITPALRRARLLTVVAAFVLGLGVLATLVAAVIGALDAGGTLALVMTVLGSLLDVGLKALAAGALWVLLRGVGAGRIDPAPGVRPTVWQPGEATGAVWRTAGDAAAGLPGRTAGDLAEAGPAAAPADPPDLTK
jgi:hypothetical protein